MTNLQLNYIQLIKKLIVNLIYQSRYIACLMLCVLAIPAPVFALGDLTVTPTRVIFEGRDRSKTITLVNRGSKKAVYRIEFTQMGMEEGGQMIEFAEPQPDQKISSNMIRYSPRQVEIGPGQSQTVRLLLRKPGKLEDGEYRSHLLMYAVPDRAGNSQTLNDIGELKEKEVGVRLDVIFRVSIPIIVRHGELKADFELADLRYIPAKPVTTDNGANEVAEEDTKPKLELALEREGNRSVYGDVEVVFQPEGEQQEFIVGQIKDFVVYVPNQRRVTQLPLNFPENLNAKRGVLKTNFSVLKNNNSEILAQSELVIQ